jgi:ubiquinone biosynthesis monooxygenase Coq7
MKTDEVGHAQAAMAAGGSDLPGPIRSLMKLTASVMTSAAYRV